MKMYNIEEVFNRNGLKLKDIDDILSYFQEGLKYIYGQNINLEQNSQDGQFTQILTQSIEDLQQILYYIYNSFDLNASTGRLLDRNVAYNGIKRKGGSYTLIPITITFNQATSLVGLNESEANVFTVADNKGNNYFLETSYNSGETTEATLTFRAELIGEITPSLQTINNIITPQLGVVNVNNNSAPTQIGSNEESDKSLLERFKKSFALGGIGGFNNIKSALLSLDNVISVSGENNWDDETSERGTPAHSVWIIVEGGDSNEIAETIFKTINAGCGMRGEVVETYLDVFNNINYIYFDRPVIENYYIKFKLTNIGDYSYSIQDIKEYLVNNYKLKLEEKANSTDIDVCLNNYNTNLVYGEIKVSLDGANWQDVIEPSNLKNILTLSVNNITIIENN